MTDVMTDIMTDLTNGLTDETSNRQIKSTQEEQETKQRHNFLTDDFTNFNITFEKVSFDPDSCFQILNQDTQDEFTNMKTRNAIRHGLITIGAESSTGKSSLATALAIDIMRANSDFCCLIYSLDDHISLTGKRFLSQLNRETNNNYINAILNRDFFGIFSEKEKDIINRTSFLSEFSFSNLETDITYLKQKTNKNKIIIILDYLQIIPLTSFSTQREQFNEAVKTLKDTQKKYENEGGCILLLLSQLARKTSENKNNYFRHRETSEIENVSDVIIEMEKYPKEDIERQRDRIITILKNKIGSRESFETSIKPNFYFEKLKAKSESFDDQIEKITESKQKRAKDDYSDVYAYLNGDKKEKK